MTLKITDQSPLEDLTLDWKSTTNAVPPDVFQAVLTAVTPNLGKFIASESNDHSSYLKSTSAQCEDSVTTLCDGVKEIDSAQMRIIAKIKEIKDPLVGAHESLQSIHDAAQPLVLGAPGSPLPWKNPPCNTATIAFNCWKSRTSQDLKNAAADPTSGALQQEISNLKIAVDKFQMANTGKPAAVTAANLQTKQALITTAYKSLEDSRQKLLSLADAISNLPEGTNKASGTIITDVVGTDTGFYQTQVWNLNYTNTLVLLAKRFTSDPAKSQESILFSNLSDVAAKTTLLSITVQFQSPSRIEVSSGLMVPGMPYHSFTKAAVAKNGVVTDNVVQQTLTYAVIPMAFINGVAHEWVGKKSKQRSAFLVTNGVGYNPANSTVEFGSGLTFSYRSLALSFLADIGRDTQLNGGFTVGESLGATNAASNPLTMAVWKVKPAIALSIRIPLASSSGASK